MSDARDSFHAVGRLCSALKIPSLPAKIAYSQTIRSSNGRLTLGREEGTVTSLLAQLSKRR